MAGKNREGIDIDEWAYAHQSNLSQEQPAVLERRFRKMARFYRALMSEYLPRDKDALILDVPCGEGNMAYALKKWGYRNVEGCDLDENRLATAAKLGLPVRKGDAFDILERSVDASIRCITCLDFIEHISKEAAVKFLMLAGAKLATGGTLILRTPCADSPFGSRAIHNDLTHKWAPTSGVLRHMMKATGFTNVQVFAEHPRLGMSHGLFRVLAFQIARIVADAFVLALNQGRVKIWSSCMWAVGVRGDAGVPGDEE